MDIDTDNSLINNEKRDAIVVINFGGQYAHLIARRIRELRAYSIIVNYDSFSKELLKYINVKAIILSGGPSSVYEENAPTIGRWILDLDIPILGICYGHQLLAKLLGGSIKKGKGEFGRVRINIIEHDQLFHGWDKAEYVWMSHDDYVEDIPNAKILAISENGYIAAFKINNKPIYGVQFHPEVKHTKKGIKLFENFLFRIVKFKPNWFIENIVDKIIDNIKSIVPRDEKVLVAVSGGVDSTTTAVLVKKAIGDRLVPVFVNHGLMRENEVEEVLRNLDKVGIKPIYIDASERFLSKLEGVVDCEERRRIIGEEFARIFKEIVDKDPSIKWLAQGTTYPDVIESGAVPYSSKIKSHHNVAGLPEWLKLKVLEPLREFYKDEVRRIALMLGIPKEIVYRHPFPGPGLAVRIIGKFTREKLEIVRKASYIVEQVLKKHGWYDKVWQAFAVVGDDKWVGVKGDKRSVGRIIIVRIVESEDGMTADWARIPHEILDEIAREIITEIPQITMVAYSVTTKPPSTIEPC